MSSGVALSSPLKEILFHFFPLYCFGFFLLKVPIVSVEFQWDLHFHVHALCVNEFESHCAYGRAVFSLLHQRSTSHNVSRVFLHDVGELLL